MTLARSGFPATAVRGVGDRLAALSRPRRWALIASAVWVVVVVTYALGFLGVATGSVTRGMLFLDVMFLVMTLALPLILIWLAAWLAEELERQREIVAALAELTVPLIGALGATRGAFEAHAPVTADAIRTEVRAAVLGARGPDATPQLDRLLAGQARLEVSMQKLAARAGKAAPAPEPVVEPRPEPAPVQAKPRPSEPPPEPQVDLPGLPLLEELLAPEKPGWADLVRALGFPRDPDDEAGFRSLRVALRHHGLAQMLQAAEDVLNLLSQEGVFVDDLPMEPVDPAAWRRFIAGGRGTEVAALGGIRDERALETARGLMKTDTIFRDTALFFQRRFDTVLGEFAADCGDAQLIELADTRSGRAFMLLARLSGSLD